MVEFYQKIPRIRAIVLLFAIVERKFLKILDNISLEPFLHRESNAGISCITFLKCINILLLFPQTHFSFVLK
jgi:hypothetical protein